MLSGLAPKKIYKENCKFFCTCERNNFSFRQWQNASIRHHYLDIVQHEHQVKKQREFGSDFYNWLGYTQLVLCS